MLQRINGNTIRRPHRWRFLPAFVFLVMAIVLFHPPDEARASSDVTADVNKTTGELTFVLTAKKASSSKNPHWRTIGFYVSKKATGQNGVAGTAASKCVFFSDMPASWKKDRVLDNGTVETTFTISKENFIEMCEKAGVDQESLEASGGYVYLQGVLQGYKPSNGKALTERCYTLEQMKNTRDNHVVNGSTWKGIAWSRSCNDGWKARYDIKVTYPPVESPVTINYYQSQAGKWVLVASVTNSKDGRIEETESGGYFTKNVNTAATDYQWQSSETGYGSIVEGNGLGLSGNGTKKADGSVEYDGLYYYGKKKIDTTSKSLPTKLSKGKNVFEFE